MKKTSTTLRLAAACAAALVLGGIATTIAAPAAVPQNAPARTVVLDTTGLWRLHQTFKPPVIRDEKGVRPILAVGQPWLHEETPEPPANWTSPDFDDVAQPPRSRLVGTGGGCATSWLRGPARIACETPFLSRLCLRGKFTVTDPAKVKDLTLDLGWWGGAVVYVNGVELKRGNLEPGDKGRLGLAQAYPEEAYYFGNTETWEYVSVKIKEMDKIRSRTFSGLAIPGKMLRKGVNVLAVEIIRSPYNKSVEVPAGVKRSSHQRTPCTLNWPTCSIRYVQLTAASGVGQAFLPANIADKNVCAPGLVPNATRPKGLQVWNSSLLASDFDLDFGDVTEPLRPVQIVGARNGSFSGKVVVGSDSGVAGLAASVSDFKGPGAKIPASAFRVRFGVPWGEDDGSQQRYPVTASLLGALAETPPAEIPVRQAGKTWRNLETPNPVAPVFGAVASVWVTADVPADARPGSYEGRLTIRAKGEQPVEVPVRLEVVDWTLPDPDRYRTWVELTQSPDTLALEYGVKPWSDEHFALIARSMRHINRIGSRVLYVPLIAHANIGNAESMVRWIRKGDACEYDFSVMDRYLDTAEKSMGRPKVVCFWVWDRFLYLRPDDTAIREYDHKGEREAPPDENERPYIGKGPMVTFLDPATGKTENRHLPAFTDPQSKAMWKPLIAALEARMKKRGLRDAMMIGTASDVIPRKEQVEFFNEVAPGLPWVGHAHANLVRWLAKLGATVGYCTSVFDNVFPVYPQDGRSYGWKNPALHAYLLRNWYLTFDQFPITTWRHCAEVNITGGQRGIGHLGADYWVVVKDKRKRRMGRIYELYPEGNWRSNDVCTSLLAPGVDGPIATVRYEVMREGVQECEARIFIERALTDEKLKAALGADLAARCQDALDERLRCMIKGISNYRLDGYIGGVATNATNCWWNSSGVDGNLWFISTDWQGRSRKLYSLAGEVARKVKMD
jgi:hypothetical protein